MNIHLHIFTVINKLYEQSPEALLSVIRLMLSIRFLFGSLAYVVNVNVDLVILL